MPADPAKNLLRVGAAEGGSLLGVHVRPRASRAGRGGIREGALELRVTAPPVDGAANAAARELIAGLLGISRARVSLHAGETSRRKVFLVSGLTPGEVRARIALSGENSQKNFQKNT